MKKNFIIALIFFITGIFLLHSFGKTEEESARKSLSKYAIRFHVLANSDSLKDQQMKMKVKEHVIDYIYKGTRNYHTREEVQRFLANHNQNILDIASQAVRLDGCDYHVTSSFGEQDFPEKQYGDVVFPKGTYVSYTLSIGKGNGHNWWCVLYPPLCFVDASCGIVPDDSKKQLRNSLSEQEYHSIIRYRFKYLTFLKKYLD